MVMYITDEATNTHTLNSNNQFEYKLIDNKIILKNDKKSLCRYDMIW